MRIPVGARLAGGTVYLETGPYLYDDYDRLLAFVWLETPDSRSEDEARADRSGMYGL